MLPLWGRRCQPGGVIPILYADPHVVVLNKPAGLPVHPGPRGGPSVEDWFPHLSRRRAGPWLAHRLDADTAGCLVVALRRAALLTVQAAFAAGQVGKVYWAIVDGAPAGMAGVVDAPLLKVSTPAGWRMVVDPAGQAAQTAWRVMGSAGGRTWLELRPATGRTHQVRVHCSVLGCPVAGDPVYGGGGAGGGGAGAGGGLHLLARAIALPLDPPITVEAPPPPHMLPGLRAGGWVA